MEINSKEYWNARFEGDWAQKGGLRQTAGFARMLLANMPGWLKGELERGISICDWGCAEGDATRLLAEAFPSASVTGVDFAANAVESASRRFTGISFKCEDWTATPCADSIYDCVVASNVLEHFRSPYEVLWNVLAPHARRYLVVVVPYREYMPRRCPEHEYTFCRDNIPMGNDGWQCVGFTVVDEIPDKVFNGRECIITFARRDLEQSWMVKLSDVDGADEFARDVVRLTTEKQLSDEKAKTAEAQREMRFEKDKQIVAENAALKARIVEQETKMVRSVEAAETSRKTLETLRRTIGNLRQAIEQNKETMAAQSAKLARLTLGLAKRDVEIAVAKQSLTTTQGKSQAEKRQLTGQVSELTKQLANAKADLVSAVAQSKTQAAQFSLELKKESASLARKTAEYKKLSESKLGRLTLWYWRHKDAIKSRLHKGKSPTRPSDGVVPKPVASTVAKPVAPVPVKPKVPPKAVPSKQVATVAKPPLPKGDEGFFARMAEKIKGMPESNGCRYYERLNKRIAVICDQFYWDSVKSAADFVYIDPAKWQECIKNIDCLLIVSAWHGLGDGSDWQGLAYEGTKRRQDAYEIIDTCKARGVPTVFYSKEDPPSYAEFLGLAKRCDCVFTSDDGCVSRYQADCGHSRVFPLRFCINPNYHNPVGSRHCVKERNVFFAGSWMTKFPERCQDMERMFDGVLDAGRELNLVDRCYHLRDDSRYCYPKKYLRFQSPAINHDSLQKIHKLFDWCVNINTVKDSATMFANRVYELQANGNLLLSNYSLGVSNTFPNVFMIHDQKEVGRILNSFTDEEIYERQTAGVRRVMTGETCFDRVAELLQTVGLATPPPVRQVLVIATQVTDRVRDMFEFQTYPAKTLTDLSHVTPEMYAAADLVAFFDADADYGAYYLEDMINGFKYTDSDYVTKTAYVNADGVLIAGREHDYVEEFEDRARTVFWRAAFTLDELLSATGPVARAHGYAVDHFSYAQRARQLPRIEDPAVSAIIPVHNNGRFLYGRAFAALRRSSLFSRMEIIIVDDGSTDGWTPKVVRELERCHPNVRTYFFNDGGSGSPSRPRNQGVKMAKAPCIIFHDPDNEGVMDGYAALYAALQKNPETDLTIGNTVRCDGRLMTFDYYSILKKRAGDVSFTNCKEMVALSNFLPANIQTMAIRREFLLQHGLEQVPGGIGEDSLLCNQMMFAARRIEVVPAKVQIYYAERGDSIVNSVAPKFFDKHLLTEVERVKWMIPAGLMKDYVDNRYNTYVTGWYFDKLRHAHPELAAACASRLYDILKLYDGHYQGGCQEIDAFLDKCRKGDFQGAYEAVLAVKKRA